MDDAESLIGAALAAGRAGRDAECVTLLERVIGQADAALVAAAGLLLGAAHSRAGRLAAAEAAYRSAMVAAPDSFEAPLRLGLLLCDQGRDDEAIPPLRSATISAPGQAVTHGALAAALQAAGDLDAAAESGERAVALAPADRNLLGNLAVIRNAQGRFEQAAALCRRALGLGEDAAALNTLGVALKALGDLDGAATHFQRATALDPRFVHALYNLALARQDQGLTDEAVRLQRQVVAMAPDLAAARFALCMAHLPPLCRDEAEITRRRADYAAEIDALGAHAERVGAGALAAGVGAAQPFYLAYQGGNDLGLQKAYGGLVGRAMAKAFAPTPLAAPPRPGERILVGIACGHIRRHSVWRLPTRGWVEGFDRSRFELIAYHTSPLCDDETQRARGLFDRFVQGPLPVRVWRERIAADRPHVLIYPEIGMDPMVAQLAAMRLAPVQYASWGHPTTSGYPTINFFLSSAAMEPEGAQAWYSETLVRLPGLSTTVALEPPVEPVPSRASLGLPEDAAVYWCGQSLHKYLPRHDGVFAAIAARAPRARFVFVEFPGSPGLTRRFQARLAEAFSAVGLVADRSCVFLPRLSPEAFAAAIGCADVVLDSLGWSGCNSLIDALAHAIPIVTMPGETMRSRHGAAILRQLGQHALISSSLETYVDMAVRLGLDAAARAAASEGLRRGLPRLNDTDAVAVLQKHIAEACGKAGADRPTVR